MLQGTFRRSTNMGRRRRASAWLSAAVLTGAWAVPGLSPAQAAATAPRDPAATTHAWVAGFQDSGARGTNPAVTPLEMARNFDLIIDQTLQESNKTAALVDSLHAANPNLKYLVYLSGCCHMSKDNFAYPESSYAHDANGNRIKSKNGLPFMNRRDATWRNRRVTMCQSLVTQYHFDGCFYDSFGWNWFKAAGPAIDPATGQLWTQGDYDREGQEILAEVRANVRTVTGEPALVAFNGLVNGNGYFRNSKFNMLANADYGMSENFMITHTDGVTYYRAEADWKNDVDMVADVGNRGKHFIGTVKSWASGTQAQKDRLLRYVTGSFLLGAHPTVTAYLNFQDEHGLYGGSQYYALWNARLGAPTGPYFKSGNCYVRNFASGTVVVNSTTASCSYALGRPHTDDLGQTLSTASLPAKNAGIYTFS